MDPPSADKGSPEGGTIHHFTSNDSGKKSLQNGSDFTYPIHIPRTESPAGLKRTASDILIGSPTGPDDFSPVKKPRTEFVVENKMSAEITKIHEEDTEPLRHQIAGHSRLGVGTFKCM